MLTNLDTKLDNSVTQHTNDFKNIEKKLNKNHDELMGRIESVEKKAEETSKTANSNLEVISSILEEITTIKEDSSKRNDEINNLTEQIQKMDIQNDDLRNRSMRNNLIFRNIKEHKENRWEDTVITLIDFISSTLNIPWDDVDYHISRAHRMNIRFVGEDDTIEVENNNNNNHSNTNNNTNKPRPIVANFINWRFAEKIKSELIRSHKLKKSFVTVHQQYSRSLSERQNKALERRKVLLTEKKDVLIYLAYPATLMVKNKNSKEKYKTLETF